MRDPNFSATVLALINERPTQAVADGRYLRKAGDTATGILRGPQPADGDKSDQFATTEWVSTNAGGLGNLVFFSSEDSVPDPLGSFTWKTLFPGQSLEYTPSVADKRLALVFACSLDNDVRVTRGGGVISPGLYMRPEGPGSPRGYQEIMIVDQPASATLQTYDVQGGGGGGGPDNYDRLRTLTIFELPDEAKLDVLENDFSVSSADTWEDTGLAITLNVGSASQEVVLRFLVVAQFTLEPLAKL